MMQWMIVVVVLGVAPVKTDLLYQDLDTCWAARDGIMKEYADVANRGLEWAQKSLHDEMREKAVELILSRLGGNAITCIPHGSRG